MNCNPKGNSSTLGEVEPIVFEKMLAVGLFSPHSNTLGKEKKCNLWVTNLTSKQNKFFKRCNPFLVLWKVGAALFCAYKELYKRNHNCLLYYSFKSTLIILTFKRHQYFLIVFFNSCWRRDTAVYFASIAHHHCSVILRIPRGASSLLFFSIQKAISLDCVF